MSSKSNGRGGKDNDIVGAEADALEAAFREALQHSSKAKTTASVKVNGKPKKVTRDGVPLEDGEDALYAHLDSAETKVNDKRAAGLRTASMGGIADHDESRRVLLDTLFYGAAEATRRKDARQAERDAQAAQAERDAQAAQAAQAERDRQKAERDAERATLRAKLDAAQTERAKLDKALTDGDMEKKAHEKAVKALDALKLPMLARLGELGQE